MSGKKSNESSGGPGGAPLGTLGGFGMYPMYPNMPPYYPPGHPDAGKPIPMPPGMGGGRDPKDAPPLDLINKPLPQAQQPNSDNQSISMPPGKEMQNIPPPSSQGAGGMPPGPPTGKLPPHYFPLG